MLENPLSKFTFTQRYELSGSDVTAQLSEVFGVSDKKYLMLFHNLEIQEIENTNLNNHLLLSLHNKKGI